MRFPLVQVRNVLVTGCSSGIGAATARFLRDQGWQVVPTARKPDDLETLKSQGFHPVHLDLANPSSIEQAVEETLSLFGGAIGGVVNNAGFGQPGAIEDLSRDAMRYQFEVNVFGLQDLTNRFIPVMREQGWGRIVNVSSCLGRVCLPFMGIYSSSKFALEAISDALRVELYRSGIAVAIVEPGPITTEFGSNATDRGRAALDLENATYASAYRQELQVESQRKVIRKWFEKPPEAVARKILHALESPRSRIRYPVTFPAYMLAFMRRFAPDGFVDSLLRRRWSKRGEAAS